MKNRLIIPILAGLSCSATAGAWGFDFDWSSFFPDPYVIDLPDFYPDLGECENLMSQDLYLLIDQSGSMRLEVSDRVRRMDVVKGAAERLVEAAPSGRWSMGLGGYATEFNANLWPMVLSDDDGSRQDFLDALDAFDIDLLGGGLNDVDEGLTGAGSDINFVRDRLGLTHPHILLFSDGDVCASPNCRPEIDAARELEDRYGMFITMIGPSTSRHRMELIASEYADGSKAVYVVDEFDYVASVEEAFENVVHDLCDPPLRVTVRENQTSLWSWYGYAWTSSNMWQVEVVDRYLPREHDFKLHVEASGDGYASISEPYWNWGGGWRGDSGKIYVDLPSNSSTDVRVWVTDRDDEAVIDEHEFRVTAR